MKKGIFDILAMSSLFGGLMFNSDREARKHERKKDRQYNKSNPLRGYTPPRSMTPEEKEYYDQNKNLVGFYK